MESSNLKIERELREAPEVLRRQQFELVVHCQELVERIRRKSVQVIVTCGRGSSAHAATFAKYLIERRLGIAVAPAAPSIVTIYGGRLQLRGQLFLVISQSGQSDDIVECAQMARAAGAVTVAILNNTDSALAWVCEYTLPLLADAELSIPATKTFVATLGVLLRLVACWAEDSVLGSAIDELPDRVGAATECRWSHALIALAQCRSLATIGRGPTLAIAREAALKLKEICNVHAEAFSGAEFLHGPVSLVSTRYPILTFMPTDAAAEGLQRLTTELRAKGARVWSTEVGPADRFRLPSLDPRHPDTDAVCLIQSFYAFALALAARRGIDVERPRHLQKITRTR